MPRGRGKPDEAAEAGAPESQRLDKWLWHARFLRGREDCADLVRKGHVRLEGRRITQPGHDVRAGQVLTLALPGRTLLVEVLAFSERRGRAEEAAQLYRLRTPKD